MTIKKGEKRAATAVPSDSKQATTTPEYAKPHQVLLMSTAQSAIAMESWGKYAGEIELTGLVEDLHTRIEKVQAGDLTTVEAMLYAQAMTLQTIFTSLARRSALNAGEYIDAADKYMRLALKAQSQCRATLETLAEIKNPTPYIRQANIAHGHQQVNNGGKPDLAAMADAGESNKISQSKLLEQSDANILDARTPGASVEANQGMEALGTVHRAKIGRG